MKVLVVDDQAELRDGARGLIAALGHFPIVAADAYSAIDLAIEELPDLALVDIRMPAVDGYEAARMLRSEFGATIWICALTANPVDMPTAAQSGFDAILAKPISEKTLLACLAEAARARANLRGGAADRATPTYQAVMTSRGSTANA